MTMHNFKIRHARFDDISRLPPLLAELGYPCTLDELKVRFERFLLNAGYGVAVCEVNNEILGLVAWSKSNLFISDKVRFHIEGIVISHSHRGKGIGRTLMTFVETIANDCQPAIVDLTSGLRREKDGTHEFYKRLGYQNEGPMAKLYLRKEF